MPRLEVHPSIPLLVRLQARGAVRRAASKLRQPQFLVSALLAAAMLAIWLAVALLSIQCRERADPAALRSWIAWTLSAYVAWHVLRTACFRPEQPLEQTEHVRRLLEPLPLRGRDRVAHQLSAVFGATFVKSGLATLLLAPDLPLPLCGWLGIGLSLLAVELLRMLIEIGAWALPARGFVAFRTATAIGFTAAIVAAAPQARETLEGRLQALAHVAEPMPTRSVTKESAPPGLLDQAVVLAESIWSPWLDVALAHRFDAAAVGEAFALVALLAILSLLTAAAYEAALACVASRDRSDFARHRDRAAAGAIAVASPAGVVDPRLRRLPWAFAAVGPAGAVWWRQACSARRQAWGVGVAFLPPAALALSPVPTSAHAEGAFLGVVCALAFYAFLLLPTALKFDFRRDLDRLGLLKTLPVRPRSLALAQLATPTLLASGFQAAVLAVAQVVRPVDPRLPVAAWLLLALLNLAVFGLENWAFLKFPHRLQHEGCRSC